MLIIETEALIGIRNAIETRSRQPSRETRNMEPKVESDCASKLVRDTVFRNEDLEPVYSTLLHAEEKSMIQ